MLEGRQQTERMALQMLRRLVFLRGLFDMDFLLIEVSAQRGDGHTTEQPWTAEVRAIASSRRAPTRRSVRTTRSRLVPETIEGPRHTCRSADGMLAADVGEW